MTPKQWAKELGVALTAWQTHGDYQFEYDENGYTGWYRCVGGRLADGRWPQWHRNGKEATG
jgi:hypothetical protein